MPHSVTITGKTGPDRAITAAVINDVQRVDFQLADNRLQVHRVSSQPVAEFDLKTVTAVTFAISGGNYTITVS
jgi:hypothetical protein